MKRACPEFRVSCLQMQYDIWLFTAMLGYLSSRTLYWLKYNIYRAGKLSKVTRHAHRRTRVRRGNNRVAYSPVCHNSNISQGQAFRL